MPLGKANEWIKMISTIIGIVAAAGVAMNFWMDYRIEKATHEVILKEVRAEIEHELHNKIGIEISKAIQNDERTHKIAKALGVDPDEVDDILADLIKEYSHTIDIGIKVNKNNGQLRYLHTDGNTYTPLYWEAKNRYYFYKSSSNWEMCH